MLRFASNKQLIALALILVGLGLLLFGIPQLSEANEDTPTLPATEAVSDDLRCINCHSITQQFVEATTNTLHVPDPCDVCHTAVVDTQNPLIERANRLEKEWRQLSARTIDLQQQAAEYPGALRIETDRITILLDQANLAIQAGDLVYAEQFLDEAHKHVEQATKTLKQYFLLQIDFDAFCLPGHDSSNKSCQFQGIIDRRVAKDVRSASTFSKQTLVDHLSFWLVPADVMHRRSPPVDEDGTPVAFSFITQLLI